MWHVWLVWILTTKRKSCLQASNLVSNFLPMPQVATNCCNLANTSSLLTNFDLRKISEWPICHSVSDKLSFFFLHLCQMFDTFAIFCIFYWKKNVELLVKASVIFLVRVTPLAYPDLQQADPTCLDKVIQRLATHPWDPWHISCIPLNTSWIIVKRGSLLEFISSLKLVKKFGVHHWEKLSILCTDSFLATAKDDHDSQKRVEAKFPEPYSPCPL